MNLQGPFQSQAVSNVTTTFSPPLGQPQPAVNRVSFVTPVALPQQIDVAPVEPVFRGGIVNQNTMPSSLQGNSFNASNPMIGGNLTSSPPRFPSYVPSAGQTIPNGFSTVNPYTNNIDSQVQQMGIIAQMQQSKLLMAKDSIRVVGGISEGVLKPLSDSTIRDLPGSRVIGNPQLQQPGVPQTYPTETHEGQSGRRCCCCPWWSWVVLGIVVFGVIVAVVFRVFNSVETNIPYTSRLDIMRGANGNCAQNEYLINGRCSQCPLGSTWNGRECFRNFGGIDPGTNLILPSGPTIGPSQIITHPLSDTIVRSSRYDSQSWHPNNPSQFSPIIPGVSSPPGQFTLPANSPLNPPPRGDRIPTHYRPNPTSSPPYITTGELLDNSQFWPLPLMKIIVIDMGATCQNCQNVNTYDVVTTDSGHIQLPQYVTPMPDPDFYNDVTRAKAVELGEFKYNDEVRPGIYKGPVMMEDNTKYIGQFLNGVRSGKGKQVWPDFSIYEGYWENDKANGRGRLIHSDGDVYEGEWKDDKAHGKGIYRHKDGSSYTGQWLEDMQHGYGIEKWMDGSSYEGQYQNGIKQGEGRFTWPDNAIYVGEFRDNAIEGMGRYEWPDGKVFQGDWQNYQMHGKGTLVYPDGRKYVGDFAEDKKDGYGIHTWPDGRKYTGSWKDGKQHGRGVYVNSQGIQRQGEWEHGKQTGWLN